MTELEKADPPKQISGGGATQSKQMDLERVSRLVADLELELNKANSDAPGLQELREELATLKGIISSPENKHHRISERLHALRLNLDKVAGSVQYEILKDAPFVAEIGRILGM